MCVKLLFFFLCFVEISAFSQENPWLFPIKPGEINSISGSVGELRNTHFHTGLDIRTEGTTGLPVYASGDGYISRISVNSVGYGNALYIKHTNGYTTVYAHLKNFSKSIQDYIITEQYQNRTYEIERFPTSEKFKVKRGDVIAYSGNSGSSAGPHLHWDLRDPYQRPVNSLATPFKEIRDTSPPVAYKLAFLPLDEDSRVNGLYARQEIRLIKRGDSYTLNSPINLKGRIGIEILADDRLDDSYNRCGISSISLFKNDELKFKSQINYLSFAKQSSIYVFYDYPVRISTGNKYTRIYREEGNDLPFYLDSLSNGILDFKATGNEKISILLEDSYKNQSSIQFETSSTPTIPKTINTKSGFSLTGNILQFRTFTAENEKDSELQIYKDEKLIQRLLPVEYLNQMSLYLIDLKSVIPDQVKINNKSFRPPVKYLIPSGVDYKYFGEQMDIQFRSSSLFDTLYMNTSYLYVDSIKREIFSIENTDSPLKRSIQITLKPKFKYSISNFAVFALDDSNNPYFQGGKWENGKITFNTSYFGKFTIMQDSVGPVINPLSINTDQLRFTVYDKLSGVDRIDAFVNDQWILMEYDPKNRRIWSQKKDPSVTFKGELVLSVRDALGNTSTYKTEIK